MDASHMSLASKIARFAGASHGVSMQANNTETEQQHMKQQAETACVKLLEIIRKASTEEVATFNISREIETMASIERVLFVKQMGELYVIQNAHQLMLWPYTDDSVFTQVITSQRQLIVNDISKDINIANEIRQATQLQKLYNIMIVPVSLGDKHVPGACMLLLNRYSTGEES